MFIWFKRVNQFSRVNLLLVAILLSAVSACTIIDKQGIESFESTKTWILLPFQNHSGTPRAGDKVEEILATLLRNKGIDNLHVYQRQNEKEELWPILDDKHRQEDALKSARKGNFYYGITGSIEEWAYKTGVGGEPAVGLNIRIIDIPSGKVVWSATGAKSGWGAETVSGTGQKLLNELLSDMEIKRFSNP
jgi:curli biogenesis system outer membrane secretion channel CsgG